MILTCHQLLELRPALFAGQALRQSRDLRECVISQHSQTRRHHGDRVPGKSIQIQENPLKCLLWTSSFKEGISIEFNIFVQSIHTLNKFEVIVMDRFQSVNFGI